MLGLVVVQNSLGGGQDQVAELTGGQNVGGPSFQVVEGDIEAGRDDAALVDSAQQLDDDFARAVIVNDFELADVASLLHQLEELDENLGTRTEEHLSLALAFGVEDALESVSQDVGLHVSPFSLY